ncbi:hypothetical protein TNCV_3881411 [Trichonephila clavipes]|nr:hypothetical protein TNCV_3881411 [Trichonephila clavipes]
MNSLSLTPNPGQALHTSKNAILSPALLPSGQSIGLLTGGPGFDAGCHQISSEYAWSTCSLNQWVRKSCGGPESLEETTCAGGWRIFPSPPVPYLNCGGGDR